MAVPVPVVQGLKKRIPKPDFNPDWLSACYEWVLEDANLAPHQTDALVEKIETQLLLSDLDDSMLSNTGFPPDILSVPKTRVGTSPNPILVQIVSMTEAGHSAFSLLNVRQTRIDRADLAGLIEAGVEDEEESEPIPKYPRSTLSLEISDGSTVIKAMEYKRLSGLELGVTPLGCKLLLKNVLVMQGIAFLEPSNVHIFQGSHTEEREAVRDFEFHRTLRRKLGQPDPEPEADPAPPDATLVNPTDPARAPAPRHSSPPAATLAPRPSNSSVAADESFDYFDGDDELDEAYLDELAAIEQQHLSQDQSNSRGDIDIGVTKEEEELYGLDDDDIEIDLIDVPSPPPRRTVPSTQATGSRGGTQHQRGTQEDMIVLSD